MTLDEYKRKRDFHQSPEPSGGDPFASSASDLRFVVQKHDARNLHFDFRLEYDGVLKSWAVPRGPSLDPTVKRLAVEVEDHPLEYAHFEGIIPEGHYGAGRVLVWDTGTWQPVDAISAMLHSGKLKFKLYGQRLRGEWRLIRTRQKGRQPQWLLSKFDDEEARTDVDIIEQFVGSALSDATPLPEFIPPKLPTLSQRPPRGDGWIHELKMDGYRMQAHWRGSDFRLLTRSGHDWTLRYPTVADELSKLGLRNTIIDGELTALDNDGKSNFGLLQQASGRQIFALAYFAFDLLYWNAEDFRAYPLAKRKAALKSIISTVSVSSEKSRLQYLDHIESDVESLVNQCQLLGLEGIVSKKIDSNYRSGRAADWLKTKFRYRENLIVVGYQLADSPPSLSSLLVGYFSDDNVLQLAGRVGTGWSEMQSAQIVKRLAPLSVEHSPLANKLPIPKRGRDRAVDLVWLQPVLVAEIEFANWTDAKQLRQASFAGFDDEISPQDVRESSLFASDVAIDRKPSRAIRREHSGSTAANTGDHLPGLSNPDRMLFPDDGITKQDLAAYLFQINQWLLPHVANRPVSLLRCSDGIHGDAFFHRHPGNGCLSEIETLDTEADAESLLTINSLSALLATAQINAIELHPWGCRADTIEQPDRMIVDLDPDESLAWNIVVEAAFIVRAELANSGLQSFVKTTGGKGLHIVVPLTGETNWDAMFQFSKLLAAKLAKDHGKMFVASMSKSRRRGRIFLDYHRNRRGATAIAAYSLRARRGAPVSTPIAWDELPMIRPQQFTLQTVPGRLAAIRRDPWDGIELCRQTTFAFGAIK